jgi:hypothetical protein
MRSWTDGVSAEERQMLLADRAAEQALDTAPGEAGPAPGWGTLLRLPQTWGVIAARGLSDPMWFMIATFSYATLSTMALALPADLFQSRAVASVAGMAGAAAGAGTIVSTFFIGVVADRFSFKPILGGAS